MELDPTWMMNNVIPLPTKEEWGCILYSYTDRLGFHDCGQYCSVIVSIDWSSYCIIRTEMNWFIFVAEISSLIHKKIFFQ